MDITYLGAGSVRLSGRELNVICDPYDASTGLANITAKADVVTISGPEGFGSLAVPMVFDGPGEYEVKGASITGVPTRLHIDEEGYRGTAYSLAIDGVNVVVTGDISGKFDESQVENLGQVDVLVIPVGGGGLTLDAEGAAAVVAQLEPSYVVPIHYQDDGTQYPVPQAKVDLFLKEMGASPEPQGKLRVNSKEAPAETQVILLTRVA